MDESGGPDAAWGRLRRWHERPSDDDGAALDVLSDIGVLRRRLDESELAAVRAARGRAKSWADIASRLGVSRQSAWERWRDLDDEAPRPPAGAARVDPAGVDPAGADPAGDPVSVDPVGAHPAAATRQAPTRLASTRQASTRLAPTRQGPTRLASTRWSGACGTGPTRRPAARGAASSSSPT